MNDGVTVRPPGTAWSSVTVNVIESPSLAEASSMVTAASSEGDLSNTELIVPVAVSVDVTVAEVPETDRLTVKVSASSSAVSSVVATVKLCVSPAVPVNVSADVFSV